MSAEPVVVTMEEEKAKPVDPTMVPLVKEVEKLTREINELGRKLEDIQLEHEKKLAEKINGIEKIIEEKNERLNHFQSALDVLQGRVVVRKTHKIRGPSISSSVLDILRNMPFPQSKIGMTTREVTITLNNLDDFHDVSSTTVSSCLTSKMYAGLVTKEKDRESNGEKTNRWKLANKI